MGLSREVMLGWRGTISQLWSRPGLLWLHKAGFISSIWSMEAFISGGVWTGTDAGELEALSATSGRVLVWSWTLGRTR